MSDPKTDRLEIRISPKERAMLEALAEARGLSLSGLIHQLIRLDFSRAKREGLLSERPSPPLRSG